MFIIRALWLKGMRDIACPVLRIGYYSHVNGGAEYSKTYAGCPGTLQFASHMHGYFSTLSYQLSKCL
jgi:hypothetical protein